MIYVVEVHKNRLLVRKVRAEADHEEVPVITQVKEDASLDQGEGDQGRGGVPFWVYCGRRTDSFY